MTISLRNRYLLQAALAAVLATSWTQAPAATADGRRIAPHHMEAYAKRRAATGRTDRLRRAKSPRVGGAGAKAADAPTLRQPVTVDLGADFWSRTTVPGDAAGEHLLISAADEPRPLRIKAFARLGAHALGYAISPQDFQVRLVAFAASAATPAPTPAQQGAAIWTQAGNLLAITQGDNPALLISEDPERATARETYKLHVRSLDGARHSTLEVRGEYVGTETLANGNVLVRNKTFDAAQDAIVNNTIEINLATGERVGSGAARR